MKRLQLKIENDKFVKQQCCTDLGKDVRVYIIGNKVVAAVLRTSEKALKVIIAWAEMFLYMI